MCFNPRILTWCEEFEVDYLLRLDTLKKCFFIPFVTIAEAEIISDMCCGYVNNIVDGNEKIFFILDSKSQKFPKMIFFF